MNQFVRQALLAWINERHEPYPQYRGYFDTWNLVLVKHEIHFKSGTMPANLVTLGRLIGRNWELVNVAQPTTMPICQIDGGFHPRDIVEVLG